MADKKSMFKMEEKIELREPIDVEALHALMEQSGIEWPGQFKISKGLFGKTIAFDSYMNVVPVVHIKNNIVKVKREQPKSDIEVLGVSRNSVKAQKEMFAGMKEGGLKKGFTGGQDYFLDVCDLMQELLAGK